MTRFKPKVYLKDYSRDPFYNAVNTRFLATSRLISFLLVTSGFAIFTTQVAVPLVFFETGNTSNEKINSTVLGVTTGFSNFSYAELNKSNVLGASSSVENQIPKTFTISIPKLKIKDAVVETNSTNLNPEKVLGHYNGSSLPGHEGNAFIYGHSVLPFFYNPKNYKTIFSTLDKLETNDEIEINFDGITYKYKIESKEILSPDKVNPIGTFKPAYLKEKTLELMTCWPAGAKTKRLLVKAVLSTN